MDGRVLVNTTRNIPKKSVYKKPGLMRHSEWLVSNADKCVQDPIQKSELGLEYFASFTMKYALFFEIGLNFFLTEAS